MDRATALDSLNQMTEAESAPALAADELNRFLDEAALVDSAGNAPTNNPDDAGTWTADTAVVADIVIADPGGRYWRCIVGGTTGAQAPSWPNLAGAAVDRSITVVDGSVRWADNGGTWAPAWDLNRAAMLGWEAKAGKASSGYDFRTDDQQFARSQIAAQCHAMADRYRRLVIPAIA